jgi:PhzF family phenazine biosynthesis protein
VDLCGHATLASAFVLFELLDRNAQAVTFHSLSGPLHVVRQGALMVLDFPARPAVSCEAPAALSVALGTKPRHVLRARDYLAVFESEDEIRALEPNMELTKSLDTLGVIVTAPGRQVDFVSRFFAPKAGIPEDPVTGAAHCTLIPYWSERLGKRGMQAHQVSARGGELSCEHAGERVRMGGRAVLYLEGSITI